MCLAPLYSCVARGHITQPLLASPFGLGAASPVAIFFGGWAMVWSGVVPAFFLWVFLGWCAAQSVELSAYRYRTYI